MTSYGPLGLVFEFRRTGGRARWDAGRARRCGRGPGRSPRYRPPERGPAREGGVVEVFEGRAEDEGYRHGGLAIFCRAGPSVDARVIFVLWTRRASAC